MTTAAGGAGEAPALALLALHGLVVPLVDEVEGIEQPREPGLSALGVGEGGPRRRRGRPTSESAQ